MKILYPVLELAHQRALEILRPNDVAVDATVGNGNDTLLLAKAVGRGGLVYGFDIQETALSITRQKLIHAGAVSQVRLIHDSHHKLDTVLPTALHGHVRVVQFNLGYLPGGDRAISTRADTTVKALDCALRVLKPGGLLSIVAYTGHPEGAKETEELQRWLHALPRMRTQLWKSPPRPERNHPPQLFLVYKGAPHRIITRLVRRWLQTRTSRANVQKIQRNLGLS
ncbi:MAG: class I SAM-dependent methyltransferase [Verrucomicrobiota bacterium]|nr:class I SAM-dependent methyltransferase [Verrucomicrobiota bacterium]